MNKKMTLLQKRRFLNKELNEIKNTVLQDWLNSASKICPEMSEALEGIYCGKSGRIHVELCGDYKGCFLTMGWHTIIRTKVEYAYVS